MMIYVAFGIGRNNTYVTRPRHDDYSRQEVTMREYVVCFNSWLVAEYRRTTSPLHSETNHDCVKYLALFWKIFNIELANEEE